ncbi:uncharacterized protein LOC125068839 isoform X2 [Vanessa atalanta]|uniref:uncharacterized protein LOC125068839 isoform X2 n=1 Tax=Vanessa atalanta TaxID=42275 RepID=UPI001FCD055C|nr:uncharacterized protein LOC125068839 isoform X2 [Vanessa atalanta]
MTSFLVLLLVMAQIYKASNLPNHLKISSKDVTPVTPLIIEHPQPNAIPETKTRKKKGPTIPLSLQFQHQYLVPNLHVIPLVHDLTVIPLHRVSEQKISYRLNDEQDDDRYRNPLGGYGVGWRFGGHGAGHGFHYSYG